ncbi:MAG: hydrolase, partial [Rhodococcus sp.]|nr:hydrolase [Rhodococcus sp. (in: high G+C Gram-positive bacteria)]
METVPIQLPDGTVTPIRLFPGPNDDAPVVVMLPGLGVPAGFYDPVAQA